MSAIRMGLHRMSGRADSAFRDYVEQVRPNMVKFLDPGDGDDALAAWCRSLGTEVIGRIYFDPQELGAGGGRQIDMVVAAARRLPSIRYWELHNETWQAGDDLVRYAELSIDFMKAIEALGGGRRGVIGCFSVGMPDLPDEDRGAQWRLFAPALRYAAERGHLLGLHQYGGGSMGMKFDPPWYALRHRQVLAWAKAEGVPVPRIVITESGIDNLERADRESRGWQTMGDGYDYAADLAWFAERLSEDPMVVGAVDFGYATIDPRWGDFDLSSRPDVLHSVAVRQREIKGTPKLPTPVPPKGVPSMTDLHQMLLAEFGPDQYEDLRSQMADRPGFNSRPLSGVDSIAIHHTVSAKNATWKTIRDGHWARGFSGVGYHLGIRQGKLAYLGDVSLARACVAKLNHRLICLVFMGNYAAGAPDPADLAIARRTIRVLDAYLGRRPVLRGHRDFMATECPGQHLYAEIQGLRSGAAAPVPAPSRPDMRKVAWFLEETQRRMEREGLAAESKFLGAHYTADAIRRRDG